ncbi:hypothetical protein N7499_002520 [Penicillium canescens]|uniref:Epidermal growth factor receptor-like transmembrane-juxtamembrane segment domain-containing protein n=1 Tax=Penicillium canescens TaxID=5083 RepID=A0AAD6N6N7_PENCN|nr:hypothetical protein N7522_006804 [Penicillium canescens]KAJ6035364.1 hypothetical protein N7460_009539 [Penicillium canescens]KAJ6098146.1 hypothetical protein N7499_002520 [Penicillium canescens]KAJ6166135.1 hypothetical protein N7485_009379 [Penicillium canescens]
MDPVSAQKRIVDKHGLRGTRAARAAQSVQVARTMLLDNKHCANETANVYKADGYFCCANGTSAFQKENGFVGCADDISDLNQSMTLLAIEYSAPTTTSQSPTNTGGADTGDSSSSSNTGAIAGGVVGGVAGLAILIGLIWFFLRRRSQSKKSAAGPTDPSPLMSSVPALNSPASNAAGSTQPGSSVSGSRSPDANSSGYYNTAPETTRSPVELESQADSGLHELPSLQAHR